MEGTAVAIAILVVVVRFGMARLRVATLVPVALILVFLLGTRNGTLLDQKYSARTLAHEIAALPDAPHVGGGVPGSPRCAIWFGLLSG